VHIGLGRKERTSYTALRQVYDPITEGCLVKGAKTGSSLGPSRTVRRLGIIATFVVSGLIHEFIFWCVRVSYGAGTAFCLSCCWRADVVQPRA
jgi:hypothetical protein